MRILTCLTLVCVVAMPGSAIGQTSTVKASADPERVICRSEDVIGSRLSKARRCLTLQQWARLEREQRETTEKVQRLSYDCKVTGSC